MKKDADDAQTAIISSSEKVILDFLDRDIAAPPKRLQPVTAEQAIAKLVGRIGQDDWNVVLETWAQLPAWMVMAIQKGVPETALVPIRR